MLRLFLSLCSIAMFVGAATCDFSDNSQRECEIGVNNMPVFLHKFIDDENNIRVAYSACIYDGKIEIYDEEYDVINCSMSQHEGMLTEGVILANTMDISQLDSPEDMDFKLMTNKNIELADNNILLRVAGDFLVDSGIRINSKKKNFVLEMIEGSNGLSNIVLQRGAGVYTNMIIMPEGDRSNISLNTYFGGVQERGFIDFINNKNPDERGNMETILSAENFYSISEDGDKLGEYNGNVICGPEIDPFDQDHRQYVLKRIYNVKNTSKDAPDSNNSVCDVENVNCFSSVISYRDIKVYGRSYKIATGNLGANLGISDEIEMFVESGKIVSKNSDNLSRILPDANIIPRNYGFCGEPNQIAMNLDNTFYKEIKDEIPLLAQAETLKPEVEEEIKEEIAEVEPEIIEPEIIESEDEIELAEEEIDEAEEFAEIDEELDEAEEFVEVETEEEAIVASAPEVEAKILPEVEAPKVVAPEPLAIRPVNVDEDFLIVEEKAYKHFRDLCNGDLNCIYGKLKPYDKIIWDKVSSSNNENAIYIVNFTNGDLDITCNVLDYYDETLRNDYKLSTGNRIGILNIRFPYSDNKSSISCKSNKNTKITNKIRVNPAKFALDYKIESKNGALFVGSNKIFFDSARALTLENEIDSGFSENLVAESSDITFTRKNKCDAENNAISSKPISLAFRKGIGEGVSELNADKITSGKIDINFRAPNNYCSKTGENLEPLCVSAQVSGDVDVIPANFMIKTDIIASQKIAYYGQIDDRRSFKFNPTLNIKITPLDNKEQPINIVNDECNYGYVQLNLKSDKPIEFKRKASDRLDSKINIYLDEFQSDTANIDARFGIIKVIDSYKNTKKIGYGDLVEPQEIALTDLNFDVRFKSNDKFYDYNDVIIYDRLNDDSTPQSVLIARGALEPQSVYGENGEAIIIAKYKIYCDTCDIKTLSRYLEAQSPELDSPTWFINTKHPSDLFIDDDFIITELDINNTKRALEGRQQITFSGGESDKINNVGFNQSNGGFAPYLYYMDNFKGAYVSNSFKIITTESAPIIEEPEPEPIAETPKPEPKPEVEPAPKPVAQAPKPAQRPVAKPAQRDSSVLLDIED